jgi:translocator protein
VTRTAGRVTRTAARDALGLAGALGLCLGFVALNGAVTRTSVGTWYRELAKPAFTPPDAVFPAAGGALFFLMGVALWRVWRLPASAARGRALLLFAAQLGLNLLWSCLFFGLRSPALALAEVAALWAAILGTAVSFWRLDRAAGALLVPYLAWVAFAAVLNGAIVGLN